jgi:putative selenium metabolism hydrolase
LNEKIKQIVNELRPELITFTREIIKIPSFSGKETQVITRIKEEMEKLGYKKIQIDEMGNLSGQIGSGKHLFAIDGHADTVEVGNRENWSYDPFEGKLEEGIIYGRGACDQKGGVASAIYAGKILNEITIPEDMTYLVVISVQEEIYEGLNWTYIIQEKKTKPDVVVLTEPTGLNICNGQRGRVDIKVQTSGIASHGASPDLGDNAIYKLTSIVEEIKKMDSNLPEDPIFGKGNITVTEFLSSAPSINAVPDSASIHIDRRLTNLDTEESVLQEIMNLESVKETNAYVYIPEYEIKISPQMSYPIKAYYSSWYMEEAHPLVQTAINAYEGQLKHRPILTQWRFSTNGATIKGIFDIPTIGFGPGFEKYAHTVEDQVSTDHLIHATEFYAAFALIWGKEQA